MYNCSVGFKRDDSQPEKHLYIYIQSKDEKTNKLELKYKRVEKTPIWFKIEKEHIKKKYFKTNKNKFSTDINDWETKKYI